MTRQTSQALRTAVKASSEHAEIVPFSAKIEAELAELPRRTARHRRR